MSCLRKKRVAAQKLGSQARDGTFGVFNQQTARWRSRILNLIYGIVNCGYLGRGGAGLLSVTLDQNKIVARVKSYVTI